MFRRKERSRFILPPRFMITVSVGMFLVLALGAKDRLAFADWPQSLTGERYRVVDGDTIHLEGQKIRLLGIDAPEMKQFCRNAKGEKWNCGILARDMLAGMLGARAEVTCILTGRDKYKRFLGRCFAGDASGLDVQRALVRGGFAVAEYTKDYIRDEARAKAKKYGIWAGTFLRPKDYRRQN